MFLTPIILVLFLFFPLLTSSEDKDTYIYNLSLGIPLNLTNITKRFKIYI